jgi:hypothetical protein
MSMLMTMEPTGFVFGNDRFQIGRKFFPVKRVRPENSEKVRNGSSLNGLEPCHQPESWRTDMSKSDVQEAIKRAKRQVENTSAGGHLGGTYYGQGPDGKTSSMNGNVGNNRTNSGS